MAQQLPAKNYGLYSFSFYLKQDLHNAHSNTTDFWNITPHVAGNYLKFYNINEEIPKFSDDRKF